MKIEKELNEKLKDAVSSIRQYGEPIEVFWGNGNEDAPHDAKGKYANEWDGSLASMRDLRQWIEKQGPDGREVTIYCRGDFRGVVLTA